MFDLYFPYRLYENYNFYEDKTFEKGYISYKELVSKLDELPEFARKTRIGKSFENRDIYLVKFGNGTKRVLIWSQMHGDEPTGTRLFFDLMNFMKTDDFLWSFRNDILNNCQVYFIPMLNPDGAERNIRFNAQGIDINRDFLALQTPEARILNKIFCDFDPEFCFNLHDQSKYYNVGDDSFRTPVISLLAPPPDKYNSELSNYEVAKRLSAYSGFVAGQFVPGHIARYSSEFEERAFGDNFQQMGSITTLFEAGFWKDDINKKFVSKIYFTTILNSLYAITNNSFTRASVKDYYKINENKSILYDLMLRDVRVNNNNKDYYIDIALNNDENGDYLIKDLGDLRNNYGIKEFKFSNATLCTDVASNILNELADFKPKPILEKLKIDSKANLSIIENKKVKLLINNGKIQTL